MPYEPYQEISNSKTFIVTPNDCKFLSLAKFNNEICPWKSGKQHKVLSDLDTYLVHEAFPTSIIDVPAPNPAPMAPLVPDIGTLSANLIDSDY